MKAKIVADGALIFFGCFIVSASWFTPTHAFDCTKASTDIELAICADPELLRADENMEQVYFSMKRRLDPEPGTLLKSSQRQWLRFRKTYCEAEPKCLLNEIQNRFTILENISGFELEMVPVFIWQQGAKNTYKVRIDAMKFAYPDNTGKNRFNREVEKLIAASPLREVTEDQTVGTWEQEISMAITQLSDRIVSAIIGFYDFSGGAHPNSWTQAINVNLRTGKNIKTTDLFSNESIETLINACRDIIIDNKSNAYYRGPPEESRRRIEEEYPGVVSDHILDTAKWHFTSKGATITFNSYAIGAYAEGEFLF